MKNKFGIELELDEIRDLEPAALKEYICRARRASVRREGSRVSGHGRPVSLRGRGRARRASIATAWSPGRANAFEADLDVEDLKNKQREEIRALLFDHSRDAQQRANDALTDVKAKVDKLFVGRRTRATAEASRRRQRRARLAFPLAARDICTAISRPDEIARAEARRAGADAVQRGRGSLSPRNAAHGTHRCCCSWSTPPGKTTCWPWTTCAPRRPEGLRPDGSQGRVQARRHEAVRADVGFDRRTHHRLDLPHGAAGRRLRRLDLGRNGGSPRRGRQQPARSPSSSRRPSTPARAIDASTRSAIAASGSAATIPAPAAAARSTRTAACDDRRL